MLDPVRTPRAPQTAPTFSPAQDLTTPESLGSIRDMEGVFAIQSESQVDLAKYHTIKCVGDYGATRREVAVQVGASPPSSTVALQSLCQNLLARLKRQNERIERLERQVRQSGGDLGAGQLTSSLMAPSGLSSSTPSSSSAAPPWNAVSREALALAIEEARNQFNSLIASKVDKATLENMLRSRISRAEFDLIQQQISEIQEGISTAQQRHRATRLSQMRAEAMVQGVETRLADPQLSLALRNHRQLNRHCGSAAEPQAPQLASGSESPNAEAAITHNPQEHKSEESTPAKGNSDDSATMENMSSDEKVKEFNSALRQTEAEFSSTVASLGRGEARSLVPVSDDINQEHAKDSQQLRAQNVPTSSNKSEDAKTEQRSYTVTVTGDPQTIRRLEEMQRRVDSAELAFHLYQLAMRQASTSLQGRDRALAIQRAKGLGAHIGPPLNEEQLSLALDEFVRQIRSKIQAEVENGEDQVQEARERHSKLCFDLANLQAKVNPGENALQATSSALHRMEEKLRSMQEYCSTLVTQASMARDAYAVVREQHAITAASAKKMVALCEQQAKLQTGALGDLVTKRTSLESRIQSLASLLQSAQKQSSEMLKTVADKLTAGVKLQRDTLSSLAQWQARVEQVIDSLTKVVENNAQVLSALQVPAEMRVLVPSASGTDREALAGLVASPATPGKYTYRNSLASSLRRDAHELDATLAENALLARQLELECQQLDRISHLLKTDLTEGENQPSSQDSTSKPATPASTLALITRLSDTQRSTKLQQTVNRIQSVIHRPPSQPSSQQAARPNLSRPRTAAAVKVSGKSSTANLTNSRPKDVGPLTPTPLGGAPDSRPRTSGNMGIVGSSEPLAGQGLPRKSSHISSEELTATAVELTHSVGGGLYLSDVRGGEGVSDDEGTSLPILGRPTTSDATHGLMPPSSASFPLTSARSNDHYSEAARPSTADANVRSSWIDLSQTWAQKAIESQSSAPKLGPAPVPVLPNRLKHRPISGTQSQLSPLPITSASTTAAPSGATTCSSLPLKGRPSGGLKPATLGKLSEWTSADQSLLEQRLSLTTL